MEKSSVIFKKILVAIILLFLFFPLIQNNFYLYSVDELKGSFDHVPDVKFSFKKWETAVFQKEKENFLNENFGLRNVMVRINNQLRYDIFEKTSNQEAMFGKDGYFFGNTYFNSYVGEDFVGVNELTRKCRLVKTIQDILQKKGQVFLPVLAPNKVRVLNNYLPDGVIKKNKSNYEVLVGLFKKFKISYIDFNAYFETAINTSKYPLYTKYGTHWSYYGQALAADSIINYLNYNYKLNAPTMIWNNIVQSDSLRYPDYDIVDGMNLLVKQLPSQKVAYPEVSFTNNQNPKPSLFVIGDSYNFGLEKTDYHNKVFSDYKFLYYFKQLSSAPEDKLAICKLNLSEEINSHKVIMLITAEFNLAEYGWGFLEKAAGLQSGKITQAQIDFENKVQITGSKIKESPGWMIEIEKKAKLRGISIDSMVVLDAIWVVEHPN